MNKLNILGPAILLIGLLTACATTQECYTIYIETGAGQSVTSYTLWGTHDDAVVYVANQKEVLKSKGFTEEQITANIVKNEKAPENCVHAVEEPAAEPVEDPTLERCWTVNVKANVTILGQAINYDDDYNFWGSREDLDSFEESKTAVLEAIGISSDAITVTATANDLSEEDCQ